LHVVASKAGDVASTDIFVNVTPPLSTTPASPAHVDPAIVPSPADPMIVHAGDLVPLELKASTGARAYASFGSGARAKLLQDSSEQVGGIYKGQLRVPRSASGVLRVHYSVTASDGTSTMTQSRATIRIVPNSWDRVGFVVLADRKKDIDARPYGIVESSPDGDWLFYPQAGTPFRVTGSDGDYYRVALGSVRQAWILKRSLRLAPSGRNLPPALATAIEIRPGTRESELVIHLSRRVPFGIAESVAGPSLRVRLYGMTSATSPSLPHDVVSSIDTVQWEQQHDETAVVSLRLRKDTLWGYHTSWSGNDLVIAVKGPPVFAPSPASPLKGLLVVIDPGHSPDPGSIGPLGTKERDVNLAIAKRLAAHLEDLGARAVLTRTANEAVGLYDRTDLATRLGADVLLSVHNNALPDGANPFAMHGFSVYYYQPQSLELARAIHAAYLRNTHLMDGGVIRRNFALARPTEEPAVLTESAFMIWPPEEMQLRDPAFQDKIAQTITDGLDRWLKVARGRQAE
jgi:N-acetylmuramoyl-L-alanine amidase